MIRAIVSGLALATGAVLAGPAAAHVEVRPAEAAPEDPVLFEVLVPGETGKPTTNVEVAVPAGVIPFSYGETPGWRRSLTKNRNGSIRTIAWSGRLPADGLGRFTFLASTPSREGEITWKSIQTYAGGEKVRWIGAKESEEPASFTRIAKDVPRENTGGEGVEATAAPAQAAADPADGSDAIARVLGGAGLVLGVAALALVLTRNRKTGVDDA